jgi:hypothetical protein
MKKVKIETTSEGFLKINNKIEKPKFSIKNTNLFHKRIITKYFKSDSYKYSIVDGYHTIHHVMPFVYWGYCFCKISYSGFAKKFRFKNKYYFNKKLNHNNQYIENFINFFHYEKNLKQRIKHFLKYIFFNFWIILNLFKNKNKIWVFIDFKNDYRFNFLDKIKDKKNILFFQYRFSGKFYKSLLINKIIFNYFKMITSSTRLWKRAFKILKPKKIIILDNLYDDASILIAAKAMNIETIGISHGPFFKCTKYLMGEKFLKNKKTLKHDRLYVWHKIFKKMLNKNSYIYNKKEVLVCGWLGNEGKYKSPRSKLKKIILAAHEDNTDQISFNNLINFYIKLGYKIIFKKRPDVTNYDYLDQFNKKNLEIVDKFETKDFKNCSFAIACKSSIIFEYLFRGIPIIIPKTGFDIVFDFELKKNIFLFNKNIHKAIEKKKIPILKKFNPTSKFLKEFI